MKKINVAVLSEGSLTHLLMHLSFIGQLKKIISISYDVCFSLISEYGNEVNREIIEFSGIVDNVIEKKELNNNDYDLVIGIKYLPEIIHINKSKLNGLNEILKKILYQWKSLQNSEGTAKFFSKNKWYDSNIVVWTLLNERNFFNVADITGDLAMSKTGFSFILKDSALKESVLKKYNLNECKFITVRIDECNSSNSDDSVGIWPTSYWNILIQKIRSEYPEYKIVQIGNRNVNVLDTVDMNISGMTSLKEVKVLLASAILHLDTESDYVHLRNVLKGGVSIVLWGQLPEQFFSHTDNINIVKQTECPHWCMELSDYWVEKCMYKKNSNVCMKSIMPEEVVDSVKKILKKNSELL